MKVWERVVDRRLGVSPVSECFKLGFMLGWFTIPSNFILSPAMKKHRVAKTGFHAEFVSLENVCNTTLQLKLWDVMTRNGVEPGYIRIVHCVDGDSQRRAVYGFRGEGQLLT